MTAKERILTALTQSTGSICDDCLPTVADLSRRQVAYSTCADLASQGTIGRGHGSCALCGKVKTVSWNLATTPPKPIAVAPSKRGPVSDLRPWYWEGNVQAALVSWLASHGYSIRSVADTASRTQGKDVVAVDPDSRELWISVKGYPDNSPNVQARHWFADAVFDLILYRNESSDVHLALGLPDGFTTYTALATRTVWLRKEMPFAIYWISESGQVRAE